MKVQLRLWLNLSGGLIGLCGLFFVSLRLRNYTSQIDFSRYNSTFWLLMSALALIYSASNMLLARSWRNQLAFFDLNVRWPWSLWAYGVSQLGKYVPGNVFHLAGRQALGMAAGLPAKELAKSAILELALLAGAGTLFGVLGLPLVWANVSLWSALLLFVLLIFVASAIFAHIFSKKITVAFLLQVLFLFISGLVFLAILFTVQGDILISSAVISWGAAYVIAWLAGLVTPGAPAGLGIREVVILFMLGTTFVEEQLLLVVVVGRIVTIVGDIFFFLAAFIIRRLASSNVSLYSL